MAPQRPHLPAPAQPCLSIQDPLHALPCALTVCMQMPSVDGNPLVQLSIAAFTHLSWVTKNGSAQMGQGKQQAKLERLWIVEQ